MKRVVLFKTLIFTLFAVFAIAALFGAGLSFMINDHSQGTSCSFMPGHVAWCQGNPLSHLTNWQTTFSSIVPLLIALFFAVLVMARGVLPSVRATASPSTHAVFRAPAIVPLALAFAFSQGILHPKLYA